MAQRTELHKELVRILKSKNVYFQPPATIQMDYPCIVYDLSSDKAHYANNKNYWSRRGYTVTIIDRDPDSKIPDRMKDFLMCSFDRAYTSDNLNHFVFTLYY